MTTTADLVRQAITEAAEAAGFVPVLDENFLSEPGLTRVAAARGLRAVPVIWYRVDDTAMLMLHTMPDFAGTRGTRVVASKDKFDLVYGPAELEKFRSDLDDAMGAIKARLDSEASDA